jgi:glycosyltransferase involved in cell wall biosynthesis
MTEDSMRLLLVQNAPYLPTYGGANKATRLLLELLAARQHECRAVVSASSGRGGGTLSLLRSELAACEIDVSAASAEEIAFHYRGVEVHAAADPVRLRTAVADQLRAFEPDWVLVASEDPEQVLLEVALEYAPARVVYVAQTLLLLPFGPACFQPSPARTALLGQAAGIITISGYAQEYMRRWGNLDSTIIPLPVYGAGPFPRHGTWEQGFVTMVNPCAYKGLAIFLELARRLPQYLFAAVASWGTTDADIAALAQVPNVRVLDPVGDIDAIFAQTRILLVPSLWDETFGYVVVEAMLRGIPTLASNVGGLPEAKLGVDYVLPVQKIEGYTEHFDDRMNPIPLVPEQDIGPWETALRTLLADRVHYEQVAAASREAALAFVRNVNAAPAELFLERLGAERLAGAATTAHSASRSEAEPRDLHALVKNLSPERRALLERRLRQQERRGS